MGSCPCLIYIYIRFARGCLQVRVGAPLSSCCKASGGIILQLPCPHLGRKVHKVALACDLVDSACCCASRLVTAAGASHADTHLHCALHYSMGRRRRIWNKFKALSQASTLPALWNTGEHQSHDKSSFASTPARNRPIRLKSSSHIMTTRLRM